ncbi:MAG: HAD-IA family hydrolase [Gemmatimonadales bacterium]
MLRAVFFDAGGTLVHPDYGRVAEALRRTVGRAPSREALAEAEYAGRAAVEAAMTADPALDDGSRWQLHFTGALTALGFSAFELRQAAPAIRAEHERANLWTVPQPGAADGLASLHQLGLVVGCVSNSDGTVADLLADVGLAASLDFVVDSGVVRVEKPDPEIFRIALRRAGVEADEAMHVGDLYPVDVVGARRAGIEPVLLDPLGRYGDRGCRTAPDVPSICRTLVSSLGRG